MIKFKKKNGEKGNWFSFQGLTGISVWITFCNELFVTWFACLQLEILWGTICLFVVKEVISFFLSFVLWSRLVTRVTDETWQRKLLSLHLEQAAERRAGKQTGLYWKKHHDEILTLMDLWPRSQTGYLKAPYLLWHWNQSWFICTGCLMF